ncbi:VOC family protein [Streptomyces cacaoi]|uniref:VOC family protein n=1 Tax=Streptomyces cacaoi TaxID=1898 RepID=UPI00331F1939
MLTTDYVPGTPNWLDLGAPDIDAAVDFYTGVFGWTFQSAGPEAGGYGFFQLDGRDVAAAGPLMDEGAEPSWTLYFHTDDADATAEDVERNGGTLRAGPMDVFSAGRLAQFTDPTGADFAVWQPGDVAGLDVVMDEHTLCWAELYTTDAERAKEFYSAVLSWSYESMSAGEMTYHVASAPGGGTEEDSSHGGIMQLPRENLAAGSSSEWHPYFAVTDCDAVHDTATRSGARSLMPPTDVPAVGRLAMLNDPFGATFALIKGDPTR